MLSASGAAIAGCRELCCCSCLLTQSGLAKALSPAVAGVRSLVTRKTKTTHLADCLVFPSALLCCCWVFPSSAYCGRNFGTSLSAGAVAPMTQTYDTYL